jgi:plastocyanin
MRMLLTLPLAALLIGCGSASKTDTHTSGAPAAAAAKTVTIRDFKYGPTLAVSTGTKVTWVNADKAPHTVTGSGLKLGTLTKGQRRSFTFTKAGTYAYVCDFHPFMHGTVIVH